MRKRPLISTVFATVAVLVVLLSGCGAYHCLAGQTIRTGMTFDRVYSRIGELRKGGLAQSWAAKVG